MYCIIIYHIKEQMSTFFFRKLTCKRNIYRY